MTVKAPNAAALAAWKELNDRQQGTLAAIYQLDQAKEASRKRDQARGLWNDAPASVWRRIDFAHDPSDRRVFGYTELQIQLEARGWDNQGNGSTMAALAARGLIDRHSRPTAMGTMHNVSLTRQGRAAARAGTSLAPGGTPKAALSMRSWEVLALLWEKGLREGHLAWTYSKTIEFVLIDKHVPPLAEHCHGGYRITDRGRDFYREHYAAHVAAYPDVSALHPDGAEPWPPQADEILSGHRRYYRALCATWQDTHTALQTAQAEAGAAAPAAQPGLPDAVNELTAQRHRLWQQTARQRAELAAGHVDDLRSRAEHAAREYAAVALAAFAAAVAGTDPLRGLRPPSSDVDTVDTWDEPALPRPATTGIPAIDDHAARLHAAAVGAPLRRRGPAPTRLRRSAQPERTPHPGAVLAGLAEYLRGHVREGALRRLLHGA